MATIVCPHCRSTKVQKRGSIPRQRYQCVDKLHPEGTPRYFYAERSPARVLVFDIETLPGIKRFWKLGDEDWTIESIIHDWIVLSYSYKWLFEPESSSSVLTPKEALARDDSRLVKDIWDLFNQADIIIAHNGDRFDLPRMNVRFLYYGYMPPTPYLTVDTRSAARRGFDFTSNRLAYLARYLGLESKLETDYMLWVRCEGGDKDALEYMRKYNEQDIYTLEDVYIKLRPWIKHPNMALYVVTDKKVPLCPHCGHDDLEWGYTHRTPARVYEAFRCNNCGAVGRNFSSYLTTTTTRVRV